MDYENYEKNCEKCDFCEEKCNFCEVEKILLRNTGRVVTVYTESCAMGKGFTGLVARVKDGTLKMVTSIPSAPYEGIRRNRCDRDCDVNICDHCFNSHFGSAIVIPICKILAVSIVEI